MKKVRIRKNKFDTTLKLNGSFEEIVKLAAQDKKKAEKAK